MNPGALLNVIRMFFLLLAAEAFGFLRLFMETSMFGEPRPQLR